MKVELIKKILKVFYDLQCHDDDGSLNDYETPLVSYSFLTKNTGLEKKVLQPEVIELRNDQIVELVNAIDDDYIFAGRGWMLTEKGAELCRKYFLPPNEIQ